MMVDVTVQRWLHHARVSSAGVTPYFFATLTYSLTACRAGDLL